MKLTIAVFAFCLSLLPTAASAAEPIHYYYATPIRAAVVQSLGLPSTAAAARDVLMINVRVLDPHAFRLRVFYTCRLSPGGQETTYERDIRLKPGDLWATAAFDEPGILTAAFVRIRFREEPEPAALVESVADAIQQQ